MGSLEELHVLFEGASKQRRFWYELGLFVAWHVAAFSRQKRLKPWEEIQQRFSGAAAAKAAPDRNRRRKQTPEEMHAVMSAIAASANAKAKRQK